jgi:multidrug resistance efflux pump
LPLIIEATERRSRRTLITAFVPIVVAVIGLGLIAFVRLPTGDTATAAARPDAVDPVVTGSIAPQAQPQHDPVYDLIMLDR